MDKKIFLTDIDNAVLDYTETFLKFLKKQQLNTDLDYNDYNFGLSETDMQKFCKEFNKSMMFGELNPLRDALEYIPKIADLGYKFQGITSCLPDSSLNTYKKVTKARNKNLKDLFGDIFIGCTCIQMYKSKKPYISMYDKTYYVDDKEKHVISSIECGDTGFLMDFPYNKDEKDKNTIRVSNWKEIYEKVLSDEESV